MDETLLCDHSKWKLFNGSAMWYFFITLYEVALTFWVYTTSIAEKSVFDRAGEQYWKGLSCDFA